MPIEAALTGQFFSPLAFPADRLAEDDTSFRGTPYDFQNFFVQTVANFTRCEVPDRDPDFVSFSGSAYWDLGDRVRRWSDHWGPNISSCHWYLDLTARRSIYCLCGECLYVDFRSTESLREWVA